MRRRGGGVRERSVGDEIGEPLAQSVGEEKLIFAVNGMRRQQPVYARNMSSTDRIVAHCAEARDPIERVERSVDNGHLGIERFNERMSRLHVAQRPPDARIGRDADGTSIDDATAGAKANCEVPWDDVGTAGRTAIPRPRSEPWRRCVFGEIPDDAVDSRSVRSSQMAYDCAARIGDFELRSARQRMR